MARMARIHEERESLICISRAGTILPDTGGKYYPPNTTHLIVPKYYQSLIMSQTLILCSPTFQLAMIVLSSSVSLFSFPDQGMEREGGAIEASRQIVGK